MIKVGDRILEISSIRAVDRVRRESSVAWWTALALLGGSLLVLGALVGAGLGVAAAIGSVALFLATAVVAGAERYEWATALCAAGMVWTSAGVAVYVGTDRSLLVSLLAFTAVGAALLASGGVGALRSRTRGRPQSDTAS